MTFEQKRFVIPIAVLAAIVAFSAMPAFGSDDGPRPTHLQLSPDLVRVGGDGLHGPAIAPQATADKAWQALIEEDFEGEFPGSVWTLFSPAEKPYWGVWDCWSGDSPSHSAGCAAAGPDSITCGVEYPINMNAAMAAGPFDLSSGSITAGELSCVLELMCAGPEDYFFMGVSLDLDTAFHGTSYSSFEIEETKVLDLANIPTLGSVLGQEQVWVAFFFISDDDIFQYTNGAQIDDILLRVDMPAPNQPPQAQITAPNGGETWFAGTEQTITYTASDPDGGPQPLSIDLDYTTNGGAGWETIAHGLGNTGSYAWTIPSREIGAVRVRVRASDGEDVAEDESDADFTIVVPGTNELSLGDGAGPSGGSVALTVGLANDDPIAGLQFDLAFNSAMASFGSVAATPRTTGMTAEGVDIAAGRVRVILYRDDGGSLASGSGDVATITLNLLGAGGSTVVTPEAVVLAGPEAEPWVATARGGMLQVSPPTSLPVVQLSVLKNPGNTRSLLVMVTVADGSGTPPVVTAGGAAVVMSAAGSADLFQGRVHAAAGATSLVVRASDDNGFGAGSDQITVDLP